jgi:hypothetical protein
MTLLGMLSKLLSISAETLLIQSPSRYRGTDEYVNFRQNIHIWQL